MIKKIVILITALALIFTTSACSLHEGEITDLFQPPQLGEEQQAILNAIKSVAGGKYTLKYPYTGDNRSAVLFADIDGDGQEEAAAFFKPTGMATVQLQFFKYEDEKWNPITTVSGDCAEIYQCEFLDIFGDGKYELAVGWDISLFSPTDESAALPARGLSIYGFSDGAIKQIFSAPYSYMLKINIDSDDAEEIAVISTETDAAGGANKTSLSIIENEGSVIAAKRSSELFSGVASYINFVSGKIGDGRSAIFLDAKLNNGNYISQAVRYDGDGLKLLFPLLDENPTKRTSAVHCMDINQDTIMEFPVCSPLPDYDESSPTVRYMTDWCTLENGVFITALSTIIGFSHGFYITVYEESRNTLTVEVDPEAGLYTVRRANGELTGQPIYYIKCFAQDKGTDVVAEGYTILFYSNGYILAAKLATEIYNGKPLTVSDIADTVHPLTF